MNPDRKTVIVTGAAGGIGKALARRFTRAGAAVVVADKLQAGVDDLARELNTVAIACDVTDEAQVQHLVEETVRQIGPIDIFISNAGVCIGEPDHAASADNDVWQTCWDIHVMAQVYAARAVLPSMRKRQSGYLVNMASAAGLLSQIGDSAYSATKHASVGFSESLAISHGDEGIRVSVVCPQYVATSMLGYAEGELPDDLPDVITPEQVADAVLKGVQEETFLILPHQDVASYIQFKAADTDRWLGAMRKLRRRILEKAGSMNLVEMHKWI